MLFTRKQTYIKLRKIFIITMFLIVVMLVGCNSSNDNSLNSDDINTDNDFDKKLNIIGSEITPPIITMTNENGNIIFSFDVKISNDMLKLLQSTNQNSAIFDINNYVLLSLDKSHQHLNNSIFEYKKWDIEYTKSTYSFEFVYQRSNINHEILTEIDQVINGDKTYIYLTILFYNSSEELFNVVNTYATTQGI